MSIYTHVCGGVCLCWLLYIHAWVWSGRHMCCIHVLRSVHYFGMLSTADYAIRVWRDFLVLLFYCFYLLSLASGIFGLYFTSSSSAFHRLICFHRLPSPSLIGQRWQAVFADTLPPSSPPFPFPSWAVLKPLPYVVYVANVQCMFG